MNSIDGAAGDAWEKVSRHTAAMLHMSSDGLDARPPLEELPAFPRWWGVSLLSGEWRLRVQAFLTRWSFNFSSRCCAQMTIFQGWLLDTPFFHSVAGHKGPGGQLLEQRHVARATFVGIAATAVKYAARWQIDGRWNLA